MQVPAAPGRRPPRGPPRGGRAAGRGRRTTPRRARPAPSATRVVGVQVARGVVVARGVRVGERLGARDERADLVLDVGDVRGLGVLELLRDVARRADRRARVGHGERGADPVADHARLAGRVVRAGPDLHDEVAGEAGADVLDLGDDPQPVLAQQVELGDVVAAVGDLERERARTAPWSPRPCTRSAVDVDGERAGAAGAGRVRDAAGDARADDERGERRRRARAGERDIGSPGAGVDGGGVATVRRSGGGCRRAGSPATGPSRAGGGAEPHTSRTNRNIVGHDVGDPGDRLRATSSPARS